MRLRRAFLTRIPKPIGPRYYRMMKPRDLDEEGLRQLHASITAEEHAEMEREMRAIAARYSDLPREVAVHLRQRDLTALVMQAIARVMGGTTKQQ